MFGDMLSKLGDMKKEMEARKERLESVRIKAESPDGKIVIFLDGNRKLRDISIDPSAIEDHEELEDLLTVTFNRAIEKANHLNDTEMGDMAKQFLPGMG